MMNRFSRRLAVTAMLGGALMIVGCSSKSGADKTYTKKGTIKSIDLSSRKVEVTIIKGGEQRAISGTYTDETNVTINGRAASVKDLKEGDSVEVTGRREGSGTNATFIATSVRVTRTDSDWQETGKTPAPTSDDNGTGETDSGD